MKKMSFILIGDTHGFIDDFKQQKKTILETNPEYVLCESIQNKKFIKERDYNKKHNFPEQNRLINLCKIKKIKLIGIDFKNFGLTKDILEKINKKEKLTQIQKNKIKKSLKKRTQKHITLLKKYQKQTKKPIIVIIGAYHLRPKSPLVLSIKNSKILQPCDENNKLIYEPTRRKIHYLIKKI